MVRAQSCRPIQPLCYRVLVTKQSALHQDISHRRATLWSVSRHHRVSATIPDHAARHGNNQTTSHTEPEAFFLDSCFNAHPVGSPVDAKQKLKAPNALMPTIIPYADRIVEYAVDTDSKIF
jgi:hypothetical protein